MRAITGRIESGLNVPRGNRVYGFGDMSVLLNPAFAPKDLRPPFALTFLAEDPRVLPQCLYRMAHDGLGEVTIFLVPRGKDDWGVTYIATFN